MAGFDFKASSRDKKLVKALTACGNSHEEIAKIMGVKPSVIRKLFREEMELGGMQANAKVLASIFKAATQDNNMTAAIYWAKTQGAAKQKRSANGAAADMPPSLVLKVQE
jgi:ribosome-binding protein aMBF1 (putative translation factor)